MGRKCSHHRNTTLRTRRPAQRRPISTDLWRGCALAFSFLALGAAIFGEQVQRTGESARHGSDPYGPAPRDRPPDLDRRTLAWVQRRGFRPPSGRQGSDPYRAQRGTLVVRSEEGSSVYLNGEWRGRCDTQGSLRLADLPVGSYRVRIRAEGFLEHTQRLAFSGSKRISLTVQLRGDHDPSSLQFQLGETRREDHKYQEAVEAYSAAIAQRRGAFPQARAGRARCYLSLDKLAQAFDDASAAAAHPSPVRAETQTVLANVLRAQGQYEEAAAVYRKALTLSSNRDSPEAHTGLAIVLDELDQPAQAIIHFRLALKQDGDAQPILYYLLGNVLIKLDRNVEAIRSFQGFLERAPNSELAPAVKSLVEDLRQSTGKGMNLDPRVPGRLNLNSKLVL